MVFKSPIVNGLKISL